MTRYDLKGASSRLRFLQYFRELGNNGLCVHHQLIFSDKYIESFRAVGVPYTLSIHGLLRCIINSHFLKHFDTVWVEKDLLHCLPAVLEHSLIPQSVKLVLDYVDAAFPPA